MQISHCEQRSDEWFKLRAGIPTSSEFATVMAKPGPRGGIAKTRQTYMLKLAGEIVSGAPMENFNNWHMERGQAMEAEARNYYTFMTDVEPEFVGFIRNGNAGASPDALVGESGLLEVKTKLPHLLIELLLKDEFPPEHKAQVQGQLWIAEREWCDLVAYWPNMPQFQKRVVRDEPYIKELSAAVDAFNEELQEVVARVRAYSAKEAA